MKERAKKQCEEEYTRLLYRHKYSLPPNDPSYLNLTDEEIMHELILMSEFQKMIDKKTEEAENKVFEDAGLTERNEFQNTKKVFDEYAELISREENLDIAEMIGLKTEEPNYENHDWEDVVE